LLVDIDNFNQLKTKFEKTNFYKLYKDPAMAVFVEDFKTKWREKTQKRDDNDIFKTIYNADVLPRGRVALALVLNEQTKDVNEPLILMITQWGEKINEIKDAMSKMLEKNVELGGHQKKSEDYHGVSLETVIDEISTAMNYCFIDDCFIAATNLDLLKFVIAHIKGAGSPTLSSDTDYTDTIGAVGPYHDIDFYVNIKQIIKTMLAKDSTSQRQTTITNLGLDNVTSAGCSIGFGTTPHSSACGKAVLKIKGAKKGVCKILDMESASVRPPAFISPDTYSMAFFNLDLKKAFGELGNILNSFSPAAAAWMYMPLPTSDSPDEAGLKIIDDIINHLGSQIIISQELNKPFTENSLGKKIVFCLEVNDRRALEKSLSLLHRKFIAPGNPDARRELLGYTIYRIDFPGLSLLAGGLSPMQNTSPQNTPQMPKLAFTITDTHLIFSTESKVEQTIRILNSPAAKSVASAKWFSQAKSSIPSIVGLAYMEDGVSAGELAFWMFKQHSEMQMIGMLDSFEELVDFSLLPDFEKVRKYFSASAFYGISRADGFFFEFKDLN
ncbi:MAG: hypothetical protein KAI59_03270, partial [Planctomycetes bacterium]|nr:hypothetical protein [Planctomycetota bacterium]